jgi:hypothetical protein
VTVEVLIFDWEFFDLPFLEFFGLDLVLPLGARVLTSDTGSPEYLVT